MRGVHDEYKEQNEGEHAICEANYESALKGLYEVCTDRQKVHTLADAVSGYFAYLQDKEYKNGFADAIQMMLQACTHGVK